jgi:hypothetical protein
VDQIQVPVNVLCPGLDDAGVTDLTKSLREAILSVDVDDARPARLDLPPTGAKSGEAIAVGALIVALVPPVLGPLMAVVSSWLSRQPSDVEVQVDGYSFKGQVSEAQRAELVAAYLRKLDPGNDRDTPAT